MWLVVLPSPNLLGTQMSHEPFDTRVARIARRIEIATRNNFVNDTEFSGQAMEDREGIDERYNELRMENDYYTSRTRANREFIKRILVEFVKTESHAAVTKYKKASEVIRNQPEPTIEFSI